MNHMARAERLLVGLGSDVAVLMLGAVKNGDDANDGG